MNKKVEKFLLEQDRLISEDRQNTLISLGLTEKEFSPDGKETYLYNQYTYIDGEKKYYRDIAIEVSDEEYELIVSKAAAVEAIRQKEEQLKKIKASRTNVKKWVPIFVVPKDTVETEKDVPETGKSKIASYLRICSWVVGVLLMIIGLVSTLGSDSGFELFLCLISAAIEVLSFYAFAEILDSLAELKAIANGGFKYRESDK